VQELEQVELQDQEVITAVAVVAVVEKVHQQQELVVLE
tara:strand:- start:53 stop:166 length:114 start_codon:yes stop_codon:yes gene_type:complete